MSRRYHGRNTDLWLFDTIAGIAKSVGDYVSDAYREKQGLPSEHRQYMGSLTGGEMDFAMHYQKDLEKTFHMAPSSITAMVKSLEKSGLIRREPVEKDARLKRIVLTEEGVTFQERTMENFDRLEAVAVEGIPPEDVEKFFAVLIQANQNIKKFNKEAKVADNI